MANIIFNISGCIDPEQSAVKRGFRLYHCGDYNRAIDNFTFVLKSNPANKYALAGRGDSYAEIKDYDKALKDYDKGIELYPSWAALYFHRGVCWQEYAELDGWYDEHKLASALADYTKAIEFDPELSSAYINRAFINKMMGNYELALADYDKIIELTPDDEKAKEQKDKTLKAIEEGAKPQVYMDPPPGE